MLRAHLELLHLNWSNSNATDVLCTNRTHIDEKQHIMVNKDPDLVQDVPKGQPRHWGTMIFRVLPT